MATIIVDKKQLTIVHRMLNRIRRSVFPLQELLFLEKVKIVTMKRISTKIRFLNNNTCRQQKQLDVIEDCLKRVGRKSYGRIYGHQELGQEQS